MDTVTGVIPEFSVVQVTETGSSVTKELEGFQRTLSSAQEKGLDVMVLVTDRHVLIRKAMQNDHAPIQHQFDVWHLAKSLRKKLLLSSAKNKSP